MNLLVAHESGAKQKRIFWRIMALAISEILSLTGHTTTYLLIIMGFTNETWSAWYRLFSRQRFQEEKMAFIFLGEAVKNLVKDNLLVLGVDGIHVPKYSQTMPGSNWAKPINTAPFRPGLCRTLRFVEGSLLTPLSDGYSRAIPVRCLPAFPAKAVKSHVEAVKEWEGGAKIINWVRQGLNELGLTTVRLLVLADGGFEGVEFWRQLPQNCLAIVRTPRNRALYHLPPADAHGNRKYGEQAPSPKDYHKSRKKFRYQKIMIRGNERRMRYRIEGPFLRQGLPDQPFFLLVVGGGRRPKGSRRKSGYTPVYYLISAVKKGDDWKLPFTHKQILSWIWQRWELEVAHRCMKTDFGLGHKQSWHTHSVVASVQWSVWVYGLLVLAGYRFWKDKPGATLLGKWRRPPSRWSFATLRRQICSEFWQDSHLRANWLQSGGNWLRKEAFIISLFNATQLNGVT